MPIKSKSQWRKLARELTPEEFQAWVDETPQTYSQLPERVSRTSARKPKSRKPTGKGMQSRSSRKPKATPRGRKRDG